MREIRQSGSEGGGASLRSPYPYQRVFQGAETEGAKMKDRCGNVHENKGLACSGPAQSGNVIENKYGYAKNAGILLKRQTVSCAASSTRWHGQSLP